jgi:lactoylglutathione lyase
MSGRWRGGPADAEAVSSCGLGGVNDDTGGPAVRDRATIRGMDMTLRLEIFPSDLDAAVDFYVRVLCFRMTKDERDDPESYVGMQRGSVHLGALRPDLPVSPAGRRPPADVELVLEVDDVAAQRHRVAAADWRLEEDLQLRSWGPDRLPDPRPSRLLLAHHRPSQALSPTSSEITDCGMCGSATGRMDRNWGTAQSARNDVRLSKCRRFQHRDFGHRYGGS